MSMVKACSRRMELIAFGTLLMSSIFVVASSQDDHVEQKFRDFKIVPDIISEAPSSKLQVIYKDSSEVNLGNEINVLETVSEPSVSFDGAESGKMYTLVMIDPDAPTPDAPIIAQYLHWLVTDIPGDDVSKGTIIASYQPPASVDIPRSHRYILILYEQPDDTDVYLDPVLATTRTKFDVEDFAWTNGLGRPVAGNFFRETTGLKSAAGKVDALL